VTKSGREARGFGAGSAAAEVTSAGRAPAHGARACDDLSPAYWRLRAREVWETAREAHPLNRKILEDVAVSYEEMADLLECPRRLKTCEEGLGVTADLKRRRNAPGARSAAFRPRSTG